MTQYERAAPAARAILAMADVKAAADDFTNGDTNVFDALDAICMAVDAYRAATQSRGQAA